MEKFNSVPVQCVCVWISWRWDSHTKELKQSLIRLEEHEAAQKKRKTFIEQQKHE